MLITLKAVTKENYKPVCLLDVSDEQEEYVASNTWSLVEAAYNENYTIRAIYCGDEPVGLFMWVQENSTRISIWRFMIDKHHQNKGIGRQALSLALTEIKQTESITEIEICYNPSNPVAKSFYSSFGFSEVGMDKDSEDMLALIYLKKREC